METGSNKKPEDFVNEPGPFDKITFEERYPPKKNKILNNILESIGNTPLIRLNKVPQSFGVKCEILAKCEYFNPGGSIKDRIVMRMINDAEKHGRIKEGYHLAEPSSGNTGIGFGMVGAVRGYNITCTVPDKNEGEKLTLMKAQGIHLIKTASTVKFDDPESYFSIANRLSQKLPNAATLNQYSNISNALANYDQTAEEILEACENKLDAIIIGTGTGGTITGIGNKIKEKIPSCKVVGVDPVGSLIAQPDELNGEVQPYKVEGLGHDFVPNTCVRKVVDSWVKSRDKESLDLARRMIKEEGLLIGASCGSVLYGAIRYALDNNLDEKVRIVVVMPDSVRNYMSKFLSDDWMITNEFLPMEIYKDSTHKLYGKTVKDLTLKEVKTYNKQISIKEALDIFLSGEDAIILEKDGKIEGAVFEATFMTTLNEKRLNLSDTIQSINSKKVAIASLETDLSIVEKLLQNQKFVLAQVINDSQQKLYRITSKDILKLSV